MKKNTKKKILTLALVIALLAIVMIGGSLAWFTAEDSAKNTFTVGSVKIEQVEQEFAGQDPATGRPIYKDYVNEGKVFMPIVNVNTPAADENYQSKQVFVKNVGNNPAYVRTHIAIDARLKDYIRMDFLNGFEHAWFFEGEGYTADGEYYVYSFYYKAELAPKSGTSVLLNGVYMDAAVDIKDNENGEAQFCKPDGNGGYTFSGYPVSDEIHVLVASQAVQSEGFNNPAEALGAAFGDTYPEAYPDFTKVE